MVLLSGAAVHSGTLEHLTTSKARHLTQPAKNRQIKCFAQELVATVEASRIVS